MTTYFDERARDWDENLMRVVRARAVAEAIRAGVSLKPEMSALEYGCGTGLLSFFLQPEFESILLADTSPGMLQVLADKIKAAGVENMTPLQIDLVTDPLPEARFDNIYSLLTLHHIPAYEIVLSHFYTLLKPGGILCISDLDKEDGSFHGMEVTDVHRGFDRKDLQTLLESYGFEQVTCSTVYTIQKPVGEFPMFLLIARKK
jgi:ubiquinone/menaquinone biosynthesis C-methylase UbiE